MKKALWRRFLAGSGRLFGLALLGSGMALATPLFAAPSAPAQRIFVSPAAARQALVSAVRIGDHRALRAIFGPVAAELEPGDPVERAAEFAHFARHVAQGVKLVPQGKDRAILLIGQKQWPFPVPIVRKERGWLFDTAAGRQEILTRRIGHNELLAINVCRAYVEAQHEYYSRPDLDGDPIPKYAQHLFSSPGRRDGLYWLTLPGESESPLGPLVARARQEGYLQQGKDGVRGPRPFHGYYFRILKGQGSGAAGGRFDYVINGNMVAGFALVAYPARWGVSGVMTFIVNQRGRVYQKDLGPHTTVLARQMQVYNPDLTWRLVDEP